MQGTPHHPPSSALHPFHQQLAQLGRQEAQHCYEEGAAWSMQMRVGGTENTARGMHSWEHGTPKQHGVPIDMTRTPALQRGTALRTHLLVKMPARAEPSSPCASEGGRVPLLARACRKYMSIPMLPLEPSYQDFVVCICSMKSLMGPAHHVATSVEPGFVQVQAGEVKGLLLVPCCPRFLYCCSIQFYYCFTACRRHGP